MKKKILFPLFLLVLLHMHVFATGVTLNLLHGGLSLLDSLLLIAIGLVIIGVLLICIALFKPLPEPKEDSGADSYEDSDEDDFEEDDEDDDIEDDDDTDYEDEGDEDADDEDSEDDEDDGDTAEDDEESVNDEDVSDADNADNADNADDADDTPKTDAAPELSAEEENTDDSESPEETETAQPEPIEEKIYPKLTLVDTKTHDFKILPLTGKTTIGRRRSNDLVLSDNTVSGQHCIILTEGEDIYIQDLDSTNGTFLNGKRIHEKTVLQRGDKLMLGKQEFTVNL